MGRVRGQVVGRHVLPGGRAGLLGAHGAEGHVVGDERVEEPAASRVALRLLELAAHHAHLLAQLDAEADRVVPQDHAGAALHHVGADVERGEEGVERGRAGVHEHALVEAAVLHAAGLALEVVVADVDLARLTEARELLVGGLRGDDARVVRPERGQAHREAAAKDRVELHEPGPGFVEHDVVAEVADAAEDLGGRVHGAVVGALLDDGDAEGAGALPGLRVRHQRVGADRLAEAGLVERRVVHGADHAIHVAVGGDVDRDAAGEQQGAVVGGLVVVAVEQHEVAFGHQCAEHHLVGSRGAVEHEVGALGAEDAGGGHLRLERRALVGEEVAELDDGVVEVVAEDGRAEVLDEDAADGAAAVEDAAIVPGAGPELVALLSEVHQRAEERGLERGGVVAEARREVAGDELRRLLGEEDRAVDLVQHLDRDVLEACPAEQDEHGQLEPAAAHEVDKAGGLAEQAALAPVHEHAADGGVRLDGELGIIGATGDDDGETETLDFAHDLLKAEPVEVGIVEARCADQELESALVFHVPPGVAPCRRGVRYTRTGRGVK